MPRRDKAFHCVEMKRQIQAKLLEETESPVGWGSPSVSADGVRSWGCTPSLQRAV